ncbi:helix-turn-helix domain-containing protein [Caulobacter rhizosphaerae]|uniref:helix-turn-helix domain-containing protein n=1 Tax=Caulobacter rhizosphaerae TaxID=2010972 RepID=UPI0013D7784B|nr:hypothetical protein GCM10010983_51950 [Caulobacter rhizosphaerae]
MSLESFRKQQGLSQLAVARALGYRSKGYLSDIEGGKQSCPIRLGLQIEEWSKGQVPALSLVDAEDAALLRRFAARQAGPAEPRSIQDRPSTIGGHA